MIEAKIIKGDRLIFQSVANTKQEAESDLLYQMMQYFDFSIHITQRVIEGGMNMPSVYNAIAKTAQTLAEATLVTLVGLTAAFAIKISALWWFVFIIVVLLIASMISAMFLLPALYSLIIKSGGTLS